MATNTIPQFNEESTTKKLCDRTVARKPNSEHDLEFIKTESAKGRLCLCGCGEAIIIKRHHQWRGLPDFCQGHTSRVNNPMTGKHISEETRQKLSVASSGRVFSEEHKRKIGESQKGKMHTPQNAFKKGNTICLGRKHTEEAKRKMSIKSTGRIKSPETCRKIGDAHRGMVLSAEARLKISKVHKGRKHSETWRDNLRKAKIAQWQDPAFCKKMGIAWQVKPNKPETLILNLLDEMYPGEWKYTGDFSFTINGKCPDFVNCNGQKKCLEIFGDFWHKGENPQDRKDVFSPFGFETLVIWEHELKNIGDVASRIKEFHEAA